MAQSGTLDMLSASVQRSVRLAKDSAEVTTIKQGAFLFAPARNKIVKTQFADIRIDEGSVVLLLVNSHGLSVFNFDDNHRSAVELSSAHMSFALAPGKHLTLSRYENFNEANIARSIPHRSLQKMQLTPNRNVFVSEFSLPIALDMVNPLCRLISAREPGAKRMAAHLLKTAASLGQLNRNPAVFQQYLKTPLTAFSGESQQR